MQTIQLKRHNYQQAVRQAVKVLRSGGTVVFPSDTVYGLAVDPFQPSAVDKLFQIKSRAIDKAISVAVSGKTMARRYVRIDRAARQFIDHFLPGPFTVVMPVRLPNRLDSRIYSVHKTLGIRIPDFPFLKDLAQAYGRPFTATSANISGRQPHYNVGGFLATLSEKRIRFIDLVIDMGKLPHRKPSTVVEFGVGLMRERRVGDTSLGTGKKYQSNSADETKKLARQLAQEHYRPGGKPLVLALVGNLGSGKTTFCQGIGIFFGIKRVNSPTFTISKEYPLYGGTFYHIDTYRLEKDEELVDLGFKKMLKTGNIIAIEWAEKVKSMLGKMQNTKIVWVFFHTTRQFINSSNRNISVYS